jgi:MFS transporter, DHA1 family, staphyloferrin A biosynthesis exporter
MIEKKIKQHPLYSLKNRSFRILWLGMFASLNAMQMAGIAGGWLVYTMTGSPLALGIVTAGTGIPLILFSLFGGAVADRVRKRNLLLITQASLCAISVAITGLVVFKVIVLWHLVAASLVSGLVSSFNLPARQAFLMELVKEDELTNAIALNSTAGNICRIGSPALAGVLLGIIDIPGVYGIVAICYGLAVFSLLFLPRGEKPLKKGDRKVAVSVINDVLEGLRYVRSNPTLLSLLVMAFVPLITATSYFSLMPVFAKTIFKAGGKGLGFLMSSAGIGAFCGSFILATLGDFKRKGVLMLSSGMLYGFSLVCFGLTWNLVAAMAFLFFVGAGGSMFLTLIMSLIMSNTPPALTGRVMSIFIMTWGLMPLAALPAGALAQLFSAAIVVSVGGAILFVFLIAMSIIHPPLKKLG